VTFMLAHPGTLAGPALLNRAIAANQIGNTGTGGLTGR
jgi:hypothetical protein